MMVNVTRAQMVFSALCAVPAIFFVTEGIVTYKEYTLARKQWAKFIGERNNRQNAENRHADQANALLDKFRTDPWTKWRAGIEPYKAAISITSDSNGLAAGARGTCTWHSRKLRISGTFLHDAAAVDFIAAIYKLPGRLNIERCSMRRSSNTGAELSCDANLNWIE